MLNSTEKNKIQLDRTLSKYQRKQRIFLFFDEEQNPHEAATSLLCGFFLCLFVNCTKSHTFVLRKGSDIPHHFLYTVSYVFMRFTGETHKNITLGGYEKLDTNVELKNALLCHQSATTEMLWQKLNTLYRYLNDIASLATDSNHVGSIVKYLENINKTELNPRQFISVKHKNIDIVLRRFMLEASLSGHTIDFNVDALASISTEATLSLVQLIDACFARLFECRPGTHSFLHIKEEADCIHVWVDTVEKRIFDEQIKVQG